MANIGPCQLHIPHKDWAMDQENGEDERKNYLEIELWAIRYLACFPH